MITDRRPGGPTGNLFEDWGPTALGNAIRRIGLYRAPRGANQNYVSKDEVITIWRANRLNARWRSLLDPLIDTAVDHLAGDVRRPRGRPKKQMAAEPARPTSRTAIADALRQKSSAANGPIAVFGLYVADMLDNRVDRHGRKGLSPITRILDQVWQAKYEDMLPRLRRIRKLAPKKYRALCARDAALHDNASPSQLAMSIVRRRHYPQVSTIESLRTRLWENRSPKT